MRQVMLVLGLIALAGIGLAGARASTFTAGPLVVVSAGSSPFASCTADDITNTTGLQPGRNFPDAEVEPWVDVNPTNVQNIVGSWQQDRWSNGGSRGLVAGVSVNGGTSWTKVVIPKVTVCSGGTAANGGDFLRASDPWLSFDPNGNLFHVSLALDLLPPADRPGGFGKNALLVSKSTNGLIWGDPVTVIKDTDPRFLNDKESITADSVHPGFVYVVWDRVEVPLGTVIEPEHVVGFGFKGPATLARTTDFGQSWEGARVIFDPGANKQTIGNQIVVLPNGDLVDVFNDVLSLPHLTEFNVAVIRSTDRGDTWTHGRPIQVAQLLSRAVFDPQGTGVRDPDTGKRLRTGDIIPEIAVDHSSGALYVVWQDSRFSGFVNDSIAFSMSTDGGFTWSDPIQINQTPTNIRLRDQQAFTPAVRVASDGTVGVTYYDFRFTSPCLIVSGKPDCTGIPLKTDAFLAHCHAAVVSCADPANWKGNETRLTPTSFDMRRAPIARGFFVGDYEGLATVGNKFHPFFVQSGAVQSAQGDRSDVFSLTVGP
jgi:hypothetical protein